MYAMMTRGRFSRNLGTMARCGVLAVALMWWVASVATADAQTSGRLIGSVTDAQAAVLAGVIVTATSPTLIGTQRVLTEVDGQ